MHPNEHIGATGPTGKTVVVVDIDDLHAPGTVIVDIDGGPAEHDDDRPWNDGHEDDDDHRVG